MRRLRSLLDLLLVVPVAVVVYVATMPARARWHQRSDRWHE